MSKKTIGVVARIGHGKTPLASALALMADPNFGKSADPRDAEIARLQEQVEAVTLELERWQTVKHSSHWKSRAEAAEARAARLEAALRSCAESPHSGWTIAQALARAALDAKEAG